MFFLTESSYLFNKTGVNKTNFCRNHYMVFRIRGKAFDPKGHIVISRLHLLGFLRIIEKIQIIIKLIAFATYFYLIMFPLSITATDILGETENNVLYSEIGIEGALQIAQQLLDQQRTNITNWGDASLAKPFALYDASGDIVAYLVPCIKPNGDQAGYINIANLAMSNPVIEFVGTGNHPFYKFSDHQALYLGNLTYAIELTSTEALTRTFLNLQYEISFTLSTTATKVPLKTQFVTQIAKATLAQAHDINHVVKNNAISNVTNFQQYWSNWPNGYCRSGCSPTSGANIIAYWNNRRYTNLGSDRDSIVADLRSRAGTSCDLSGWGNTTIGETEKAMVSYSQAKGYTAEAVLYVSELTTPNYGLDSFSFERYKNEIDSLNPLNIHYNLPNSLGHTVTGVGYNAVGGSYMYVHDNLSNPRSLNYYGAYNWLFFGLFRIYDYDVGEGSSRQGKFIEAYNRYSNASDLGFPTSYVYWWSHSDQTRAVVRQDIYSLKNNREVTLLHDEGIDQPLYTVPTFILQLGMRGWYLGTATQSYKTLGAPTTDEHWDERIGSAAQGFVNGRVIWNNGNPIVQPWNENPSNWKVEYWNNKSLVGGRAYVGEDTGTSNGIGFNYGYSSPYDGNVGVFKDQFSGRFTRSLYMPAGRYTFNVNADDGLRLYIDGLRVIDRWIDGSGPTSYVVNWNSSSYHEIKLEFYENLVTAAISLSWNYVPIDTIAPTGSLVFPFNNYLTNQNYILLQANAGDTGSGIRQVEFYRANNVQMEIDSSFPYEYSWNISSLPDGIYTWYIDVYDNAGNRNYQPDGTRNIIVDRTAPTSAVATLSNIQTTTSFNVSWSGNDNLSGITCYDVQYKAGINGIWVNWQNCVTTTSAIFTNGIAGTTYYFRIRAKDQATNWENYPFNPDYDTATTINQGENCNAAYEPNENFNQAKEITVGLPQSHVFCVTGDQDWMWFRAVAGTRYVIETYNLASGVDTIIELYRSDGITLLTWNDDYSGLSSRISRTLGNEVYYLRLYRFGEYPRPLSIEGDDNKPNGEKPQTPKPLAASATYAVRVLIDRQPSRAFISNTRRSSISGW